MDHRTNRMQNGTVAVIGAGISGLSAAWLLSKSRNVTLFEAEPRLGGHANTVDVAVDAGKLPVDTGFIVYNDRNYPNLVALFETLSVPTQASNMSFAASLDGGRFEYSGSGLAGLLGQKSNLVNPRFWRMLNGVMRFYREAADSLTDPAYANLSLGDFLTAKRYHKSFVEDHLLPMGAAIWSTSADDIRDYPLVAFLRFFVNHGLVTLKDRPQWRTVTGGSREYVARLRGAFEGRVVKGARIVSVTRGDHNVTLRDAAGNEAIFDDVVIAAHADEALAMLADADTRERSILSGIRYTPNRAVLHSDVRLMPRRKSVWSSWNYMANAAQNATSPLCVTYWMNRLQSLDTKTPLLVTLNPHVEIAAEKVLGNFDYSHPLFDGKALDAQQRLWQLQGRNNTWFCGAYFGSGFHEDGLQAGLAVAEQLGGVMRPWTVADPSGRITLGPSNRAPGMPGPALQAAQ